MHHQSKFAVCSFICQVVSARRQRSDLFKSSSQATICYYQSNYSKVEAIPLSGLPKDTSKLSDLS